MTNSETETARARDRSPGFPFISLKVAISRLTEFEQKFGRQDAPADRVYLAWGFRGDTSQSGQTLAALKAFGLVDYKGSGPKRLVSISNDARTFLRAQQESIRKDILKRLALKPKWIAYFWPKWGTERGPDEVCLDTLVLTHKFNHNSAPRFLSVYDETIAFASLTDSDKVIAVDSDEADESNGAPDDEAENGDDSRNEAQRILDESPTFVRYPKAKGPMLQEIFNLDEGPVTLSFPSALSPASFQDLQAYLQLFLRKAQRRAGAGDYFAEIYASDGIKAKVAEYFDDFKALKSFLDDFKNRTSNEVLRVHLPARANDEERKAVTESGARLS